MGCYPFRQRRVQQSFPLSTRLSLGEFVCPRAVSAPVESGTPPPPHPHTCIRARVTSVHVRGPHTRDSGVRYVGVLLADEENAWSKVETVAGETLEYLRDSYRDQQRQVNLDREEDFACEPPIQRNTPRAAHKCVGQCTCQVCESCSRPIDTARVSCACCHAFSYCLKCTTKYSTLLETHFSIVHGLTVRLVRMCYAVTMFVPIVVRSFDHTSFVLDCRFSIPDLTSPSKSFGSLLFFRQPKSSHKSVCRM